MTTRLVLILAGGGGHTGYAHSLAQRLKGKAILSFLVPFGDVLSETRLKPFGKVQQLIKPRHPETPYFKFVPRLGQAFFESAIRIPRECKVVISTGSNFCIPPALLAWLKKKPIVNIESADKLLKPSKTARILQPLSSVTALQWQDQKRFLHGKVFGPLLPGRRMEPWDGRYVLIACGTYGYKELADVAYETTLQNVILQTGRANSIRNQTRPWKVIKESERFHEIIAGAEVIVAPPGVTPLEAVSYGKPIVVVRYPHWSRAGTQEEAKRFAHRLGAPFLSQLSPRALIEAIEEARTTRRPSVKDGTKALAEYIIEEYLDSVH